MSATTAKHQPQTTVRRHEQTANGLQRERISEIQRARMLAAMAEVCAEHGAANVTVAHVVERAGISRRTFYEIFEDSEGCLLAAIDDALARAASCVLAAHRPDARWRERVRMGLAALLRFLDEEPYAGRLLIVETLAGGHRALERRTRVLARLAAAIEAGREEAKGVSAATTQLTAEGVVGGVASVLHGRMLEARQEAFGELLNPLMSMIVLPYLGPAAARRELERAPSEDLARAAGPPANPLKDLGMRLTYRTVRVLCAVASQPGCSNRQAGTAAGVGDQGQISKLLTRLQRLELVENIGTTTARGEPNAWTLTQHGWEVHAALNARAA